MLNIFCYQCYNRHSLCPVATGLYITGANCFPISRDYLRDHPYLACDDTCGYLTLWCVNLEVQEVSPQLVGVCACVRAVHVCLWVWVCVSATSSPPSLLVLCLPAENLLDEASGSPGHRDAVHHGAVQATEA